MWPAGEPALRTRYIALANGASIRVVEGGVPSGAPVLLVHGWGACVYSYSEMVPALAGAGFRVLAIDLPGLGLSDKPTSRNAYTTRAVSQSVADAATQLGLERFSVIGHSMGGAIGLRLALDGDRRIEKLVLINAIGLGRAPLMGPVRFFSPKFIEPLLPAVCREPVVRLILRIAFGLPGRPTPRDVAEYAAPLRLPGTLRACRLLAHHFDFDPLTDDALGSIGVPVLAVGAGRDRMVLGCAERAELIPRARVLSIAEGGHLALQECAERVNPAILEFLKE